MSSGTDLDSRRLSSLFSFPGLILLIGRDPADLYQLLFPLHTDAAAADMMRHYSLSLSLSIYLSLPSSLPPFARWREKCNGEEGWALHLGSSQKRIISLARWSTEGCPLLITA